MVPKRFINEILNNFMKNIFSLVFFIALLTVPGFAFNPIFANSTDGEIFYTRHTISEVKRVTYDFDGSTFTLGTPVLIGNTPGADGISGNPQDADRLIVGGQGADISNIKKSDATVQTVASPVDVFHLEVTSATTVLGSGVPGGVARHSLAVGTGDLGSGTQIVHAGGPDSVITRVITGAPGNLFFYTVSGGGGIGNYGAITFDTGNPDTANTFTTSQMHGASGSVGTTTLPAAHGGVFDPFTGDVMIFGEHHMTQLNLAGTVVSDRHFNGVPCDSNPSGVTPNFDQGTVDGKGHAFVASNNGHLFFVDYSASGLIGDVSNFVDCPFLASNLDDVAPLVGEGSTEECPPGTTGTPPECVPDVVGGEFLPIEITSLLLAAAQSPASWLTSLTIAALGIGAYVFTRNPNNMRNIKIILRDYLDRF